MKHSGQTETTTSFDTALEALSNRYRRNLLVALLEHNPQDDDDLDPLNATTPSGSDLDVLQTKLFHNHLPKLEEMGYIEWDRERNEIMTGPDWEEIAPLLRLIDDHQDKLPEDWL